ncbi:MAG: rod shape-determining protein MreC [Deferribacteraceae bacterium]|jgi:rod shape-determining protein MreC|nr:rod shape-determining protein MreC [Deferribacteraceae bacterium]
MKNLKRYLIVAGFLILLVVIQFRNPAISGPYKGILGNLLNPIVYVVSSITVTASDLWHNYIWLVDVAEENGELRKELDTLTLQNAVISEKLTTLENLNKLLNFRDTYAFTTTAANVIGRNVDGYMKYIIIDRGTADGIAVNDPVVSAAGLVGRVSDVYHGTSRVVLLYHHESSVSVINSRTRAVGMLKGDGRGELYVDYYDRLDVVESGDQLVTSGMGQLYPKGVNIGTVREIMSPPTGMFQKLIVDCAVDFYKLEQVLVVKHDKREQTER